MERRFRIPDAHPYAQSLPERLMARVRVADAAGGTALTRIQAETIGAMRLIRSSASGTSMRRRPSGPGSSTRSLRLTRSRRP